MVASDNGVFGPNRRAKKESMHCCFYHPPTPISDSLLGRNEKEGRRLVSAVCSVTKYRGPGQTHKVVLSSVFNN